MPLPLSARLALAAVSGAVLTTMFAPADVLLAGPLGVAGYTLALRGLRVRTAVLVSGVFGVVLCFVQLWWMRAVGLHAWAALSSIEAAYFLVLGPVVALLHRLRAWPLLVAAAWLGYEQVRGTWPFGGFPWARLAFGTVDTPVAALMPYVGSAGTTLALALLGTTTAYGVTRLVALRPDARPRLVRPDRRTALTVAAGPVAVLAVVGIAALVPYAPDLDGPRVQVAAVQGDVPGAGDDVVAVHREVTRNHVQTTVELAEQVAAGEAEEPAFVLWPENSTAVDPFTDSRTRTGIEGAVAAVDVPVVVGGIVDAPQDDQVLNQGVVWDPRSGPGDRYDKHHPVPFGEFIPFRNDTLTSIVEDFDLVPRDMLAGTRTSPLRVDDVLLGNAICFDVAYDDVFGPQVLAGAELLTVQTSNAMFIRTHQIDQQFAITRLRAMEAGRYLVVASINGRSGIVAPDGTVEETIDVRTRGVVQGEVVLVDDVPPSLRVGPWIGRVAAGATILGVLLVLVARTRGRSTVPRRPDDGDVARPGTDPGAARGTHDREAVR